MVTGGLIDSHAHWDTFEEQGTVAAAVARARAAGVRAVVAIGGSDESNALAVRLAGEWPGFLHATVGYDRGLAGAAPDPEGVACLVDGPAVVAVGETGLDYHYEPEAARAQRALFSAMLEVARKARKPVVVHTREADADTLAMLKEHAAAWKGGRGRLGVVHCFTGSQAFAEAVLALGFHVSFSGIITFRNARALREVARGVPAARLLVETDAPYLAPEPHRGRPNEPAYLPHTVAALAALRDTPPEELGALTACNAAALFGLAGGRAAGGNARDPKPTPDP